MDKISVILPIFNVEKYLKQCLDSIINQTYRNLEIICVNDGSTDDSNTILKKYADKDERIIVIDKPNGGLVSARKAGISVASGEYSIHIDSDDWIEADMIETMACVAYEYNVDMVSVGLYREYSNMSIIEHDGIDEGMYSGDKLTEVIRNDMMYTGVFFEAGIKTNVWNKLIKTSILRSIQMSVDDYIRVCEDAAVSYPVVMNINSMYILHKPFYHYRLRNGSIMGSPLVDDQNRFSIVKKHLNYYINKYVNEKCDIKEKGIVQAKMEHQLDAFTAYYYMLRNPAQIIKVNSDGSVYPFDNLYINDSVVIFGAGKVGKMLKEYFENSDICSVISWVDNNVNCDGVITIDELNSGYLYDKIIIGACINASVINMKNNLHQKGISSDKIVCISI